MERADDNKRRTVVVRDTKDTLPAGVTSHKNTPPTAYLPECCPLHDTLVSEGSLVNELG